VAGDEARVRGEGTRETETETKRCSRGGAATHQIGEGREYKRERGRGAQRGT